MSSMIRRRSAGTCFTCRQRKLKCSGEEPRCRTCINSGRWCSGYARSASACQPVRYSPQQGGAQLSNDHCLPTSVTPRHAFRQQLLSLFFENQLPEEIVAASRECNFWLQNMLYLDTLAPPLEAAILSICTRRLCKQKKYEDLRDKSLEFYGTSLHELQKAIDHPSLRYQDQTLAACLALTTYEVAGSLEKRTAGLLAHFNGVITLVQQRGPMAHVSGLAHSTFRAIRAHAIFHCLQYGTRTFLAEKQWLDIPWITIRKDYHEQLLDIMLKVPKVLPEASRSDKTTSIHEIIDVYIRRVRACWRLDAELTDWLGRLAVEVSGPLFWPATVESMDCKDVECSQLCESGENDIFPVSYRFPCFMVAYTLILYWLTRLIVCYQLGYIYHKLQEVIADARANSLETAQCTCKGAGNTGIKACLLHFNPTQLPALGYRSDWSHAAARHICQSIEYFLTEEMRSAGPGCIVPHLMLMRQYWERDYKGDDYRRELLWIDRVFIRIRSRGNTSMD